MLEFTLLTSLGSLFSNVYCIYFKALIQYFVDTKQIDKKHIYSIVAGKRSWQTSPTLGATEFTQRLEILDCCLDCNSASQLKKDGSYNYRPNFIITEFLNIVDLSWRDQNHV
ncbi:UNVERIFIED_CONTAM: hypothetical protein K2H54_057949 [Gekko kuhli]